jgi:palmitoyl transferase
MLIFPKAESSLKKLYHEYISVITPFMFKIIKSSIGVLLLFYQATAVAEVNSSCAKWPSWFKPVCQEVHRIWTQGNPELYISGYAWHNRYTYTKERLEHYNEAAWGGGLGKSYYDDQGDWHGLYAFAFLDSHKNVEPIAGYAFLKMAHFTSNLRAGIGISAFITQRPDIFNGIPFPGVLPWASISYRRLSISGTYIPGAVGAGNVFFLVAKWLL